MLPILITVVSLGIVARLGYAALTDQRAALNRELSAYAASIERTSALPYHLAAVKAGLYKLSLWGIANAEADELTGIKTQIRTSLDLAEASLSVLEIEGVDWGGIVRDLFDRYVKGVDQALTLIDRSPYLGATATRGLEQLHGQLADGSKRLTQTATFEFKAKADAETEAAKTVANALR